MYLSMRDKPYCFYELTIVSKEAIKVNKKIIILVVSHNLNCRTNYSKKKRLKAHRTLVQSYTV